MSLRHVLSMLMAVAIMMLTFGTVMAAPSQGEGAAQDCEAFPETGYELCPPFLSFWQDNGGLPVFGFPISAAADELNPDLNQMLLTQYFERERLESHPTFAPPYDILLGRLGVEVLEMMGRDWWQYPKADPSTPHYQAVTGQAIAPEFYDYYTSHGLDFGDDGVSFAESLALFGYPVSPAMMETNSSGDTVLTQWFERARFEFHPNNDPENQVLLGLLGNEILAGESDYSPIAEGLNNPRGLSYLDGVVVVAEAGTGGDDCIQSEGPEGESELCFGTSGAVSLVGEDGSFQDQIVSGLQSYSIDGFEVIGPQAALDDGSGSGGYITMGLGSSPENREAWGERADMLGWVLHVDSEGTIEKFADIAAYEAANNPDGGEIDSNPFGLALTSDGDLIVSDAGANDLLKVTPEGEISTLAVFPDRMVSTEGIPIPDLPPEIPMQAVPTGVTIGPDGNYYVGELTGFPFLTGYARVWQVTPDGTASVYAEGFTNILGVSFDSEGNLYVVEITENGLLYADPADPASLVGAVWKVDTDDERVKLSDDGVVISTGIVVGSDDSIYVSNYGLMPGMGQVIKFPSEGAPPGYPTIAEGLNNPRGLSYDEGPIVIIAEAGTGGDDCIQGQGPEGPTELCFGASGAISIANDDFQDQILTGLQSYSTGDGEVIGPQAAVTDGGDGGYITMGLGSSPENREAWGERAEMLGWLLHVDGENNIEKFADIAAYEAANNPDGGEVDSNPFGMARTDDGDLIVSDAGGNDLLKVTPEGEISTLAVFPDRMVSTEGIPIPDLPPEIPMQAVPTGVTIGPDGNYYVGELTGFPFVPGMAQVWQVTPDGEQSVYADGFTNILGVSFDENGNLYVVEMFENGLLSGDTAGAVWMVTPSGERMKITDGGVVAATGIVVGDDGTIYVSNFGVMPGMGQVIKLPPQPAEEVFFVTPDDGATVSSPVMVEMDANNFTIEVAGTARPGAGHFHIMIDVPCVTPGDSIPGDDNHQHFGAAQMMAELELEPGEHTLCLQAGNGVHTALNLTDEIAITVTE